MSTVEGAIRLSSTLAPLVALMVAVRVVRPPLRQRMAALLAGISAVVGVGVLNAVAAQFGWWTFAAGPGQVFGQPVDLVLAWAVLWGVLPTLFDRWSVTTTLTALAMVDLVTMPLLGDVVLGPNWVAGEVAGLVAVAWPAIVLGRWTSQRRGLAVRTALQVGVAAVLLCVAAPMSAAALSGRPLAPSGGVVGWIGLQVAVTGALLAVAAVWEFHQRGQGTPWPWDPPRRVVVTGPYRFVANPMQLGATVLLLGEALIFGLPLLVVFALMSVLFSVTVASLHEDQMIVARSPDDWRDYRASVRTWRVSWRPADIEAGSTLWVAAACDPCDQIGTWVTAQSPIGLVLRDSSEHADHASLLRVRYEGSDGYVTSGVVAFAHALEHVHLGWAMVGFVLRLPAVRWFASAVGDRFGFGPQDLTGVSSEAATAAAGVTPRPR